MVYQMAINGTWDVQKAGEKGWESKRMKTIVSVDSYWLRKIKALVCRREKHRFKSISGWWFGTFFYFSIQLRIIIPTDELIFFRGVGQPPTSCGRDY